MFDISPFTASDRGLIGAPPEALYDFIADMPAIGAIPLVAARVSASWATLAQLSRAAA